MLRYIAPFLTLTLLSAAALAQPVVSTEAAASQPASAPASQPAAGGATDAKQPPKTETAAGTTSETAAYKPHEAAGVGDEALVQDDVSIRLEVARHGDFTLQMGGLVQVQAAAYVGNGAALVHDDPADTEGFRVRRARFGFGGSLLKDWSYYLAVDLKDAVVAARGGDSGNEILDAKISWQRFPFLWVSAGVDKVPFSSFALQSSSRLALIERPLMVRHIGPDRRVGISAGGEFMGLQYAAGIFNGSEGVTSGNRMAGVAGAVHLQYHILGKPAGFVPDRLRIAVGGGYMYDDGPSVQDHRVSGHLAVEAFRTRLHGELLWMQSDPKGTPAASNTLAGEARRWGVAGEVNAFVFRDLLQLAVRYEYFQDVKVLTTFGNQQLISAGLNLYLYQHNLKLQANYIHRDEREGPVVENDIAFAQLQAMF
jgi:Phosphate-selective porin O and P